MGEDIVDLAHQVARGARFGDREPDLGKLQSQSNRDARRAWLRRRKPGD
ncbi:hypothetical protein [Jiangella muralis]|nr:hypothetical protein [Jiangella muralis]